MIFLDSIESTHIYLKDYIKLNGYTQPLSIVTRHQTKGVGSRDNNWEGELGNLYFSFVIEKKLLPSDLPIQSASIYFSFLLKNILKKYGSSVWLKWPNDFYVNGKKTGGTITNFSNNLFYCGIGINLQPSNLEYGYLDIDVDVNKLLNDYFRVVLEKNEWKQIFSNYTIEFENSKQYNTTVNNKKVSLKDAILNEDGSINITNEKVFSLR
jgi:BirA family biotin operon repressor/biotin-[acetyl-CoA-carboxylase] ligase